MKLKLYQLFNFILLGSVLFTSVSATCSEKEQSALLERSNFHRAKHGVPPLELDPEIVSVAEAYAKNLADRGAFEHSGARNMGENLFATSGSDVVSGIDDWYGEIKSYPGYGNEPSMDSFMNWGHFTQLIWKASTNVGCGCGDSQSGKYKRVLVCNYSPPGNWIGNFAPNVLPPLSE